MTMKEARKQIYIALEEENMMWCIDEVNEFQKMWKAGATIFELSEHIKRTQMEIVLLILDRAKKGRIKQRDIGLGCSNERPSKSLKKSSL